MGMTKYKRNLLTGKLSRRTAFRRRAEGTKFFRTRKRKPNLVNSTEGTNDIEITEHFKKISDFEDLAINNQIENCMNGADLEDAEKMRDITFNTDINTNTNFDDAHQRDSHSKAQPSNPEEKSKNLELLQDLQTTACSCTDATKADVLFLVLSLGLKHNLTWSAQIDILKGLNLIYDNKKMPSNKTSYFNIIEQEKDSIEYHIYCPNCEIYIGKRDKKVEEKKCTVCGVKVDLSKTKSFFISLSITSQLKRLVENPEIGKLIMNHRFQRQKINEDALEDIYDGEEYQKHFLNGGLLSSPHNFSYSFFTDGVPLGKSSKRSIWPIYLTINELPHKEREKYVILAGLYVGAKDPDPNFFLIPFVEEANQLAENGFSWTDENDKAIMSRVIPLICLADSKARCKLLNMQSFNGEYGCTFCYQRTCRTTQGRRYPVKCDGKSKLRTRKSIEKNLKELEEIRKTKFVDHVKGVKGVTPLMALLYFNFISGIVVDYMHNILLGVILRHTELLLDPTRKKFWIGMKEHTGIDHLITAIDKRMLNITPPSVITRNVRSLSDRSLWKASEWRAWLLFYSLPSLHGLLKPKYFLHLAMLSKATYLLLKKSITREEVQEAHKLLLTYVFYFQEYFGETEMVYNIHLLTHIATGVLNWGPMWGHNAFLYEAENRYLLQFYKSPNKVLLQIGRKFLIFSSLPLFAHNFMVNDRFITFNDCILKNRRVKSYFKFKACLLLGKAETASLSDEETKCVVSSYVAGPFASYKRILYNRVRYTISTYGNKLGDKDSLLSETKLKKNDSHFFLDLEGKKMAVLLKILKTTVRPINIKLLVREVLLAEEPSWKNEYIHVKHIKKVIGYGDLKCLEPVDICCPAIVMNINNKVFACSMPYGCSGD